MTLEIKTTRGEEWGCQHGGKRNHTSYENPEVEATVITKQRMWFRRQKKLLGVKVPVPKIKTNWAVHSGARL